MGALGDQLMEEADGRVELLAAEAHGAAQAGRESVDPDTGQRFSWAPLGQFAPIDLRHVKEEVAVHEIILRIQSRFHRSTQLLAHTANMYAQWRRVAVLDSFLDIIDTSTQVREAARDLFAKLDVNKDGMICQEELLAGFPQVDAATADILMEEADSDGDGFISFQEFAAIIECVRVQVARERGTHSEIMRLLGRRRQHLMRIGDLLHSVTKSKSESEYSEAGPKRGAQPQEQASSAEAVQEPSIADLLLQARQTLYATKQSLHGKTSV